MSEEIHVLIPTAQRSHVDGMLSKWRSAGYRIGVFVDPGPITIKCFDWLIQAPYPGVWAAWNALSKAAIAMGVDCCFLVGDDMEPPQEVSVKLLRAQYLERFPDGFGVLQGTSDHQGERIKGKWASERICGSPIIGRGWVARAYRGNGPVDARCKAFYSDEALLHVALKQNVLWQNPSFGAFHKHWSFACGLPRQDYHVRNSNQFWASDKAIFEASMRDGFPEGEPLK